MKAIDKLKELHYLDNSVLAIAKDECGDVYIYYFAIPIIKPESEVWHSDVRFVRTDSELQFDSNNWKECIVTIHNFEDYEVKMMSISISEYNRLLECEKKLNEIKSLLS